MPVVSNNKLQERMRKAEHQSLRPDAWTSNVTRGIITAVYDRFSREEGDTPGEIASRLAKNPGMIFARILFLDGSIYFLPLAISADERHLLYGNSANMVGRPVEVEYRDQDLYNGKVYLTADDLNLGIREDKVAEPFDIASAVV
jgi:hypothetical protein